MTFRQDFAPFACVGDSISCTVDGIDYEARLVFDSDTKPMDYDVPGWCFDTKAPGRAGKRNRDLIEAWKRDEWFYCGVVISAAKAGVELSDHAAALWGIEVNHPSREKNPNTYLRVAANELLPEAIKHARAQLERLAA